MIQSVEIHNFQSHKNTLLELSPGVNIIVGTSDSGKSAIIRALRWVIQGKPKGDGFRSWWGGDTEVVITTTDGHIISRKKTNTENEYDIDGTYFKAFGNDIPNDIIQALNIDELCLQKQIDQPFLLSDTPGEVAGHFNRMAHLEKIDTSLQFIQSGIRKINSDTAFAQIELVKAKERLSGYVYLDKAEIAVMSIQELQERMNVLSSSRDSLEGGIELFSQITHEAEGFNAVLQAGVAIASIEDLMKQESTLYDSYTNMTGIISALQSMADNQKQCADIVAAETTINQIHRKSLELAAIKSERSILLSLLLSWQNQRKNRIQIGNTPDALPAVEQIIENITEYREKRANKVKVNLHLLEIKKRQESIQQVTTHLVVLETKLAENMPDECPLCNSVIQHHHGTN